MDLGVLSVGDLSVKGELFDDIPELRFWAKAIASSKKIAKQRLPHALSGQSIEDYQEELKAETILEVAYMLRKISEHLENKALKRQNLNIQLDFEAKNDKI